MATTRNLETDEKGTAVGDNKPENENPCVGLSLTPGKSVDNVCPSAAGKNGKNIEQLRQNQSVCENCAEGNSGNSNQSDELKQLFCNTLEFNKLLEFVVSPSANGVLTPANGSGEEKINVKSCNDAQTADEKVGVLMASVIKMQGKLDVLEKDFALMKLQVVELLEHSRINIIEIRGVKETPEEDLLIALSSVAKIIAVNFEASHVCSAHRVNATPDESAVKPISVKFVSRKFKADWLKGFAEYKKIGDVQQPLSTSFLE